jgi:hypothetical protein
MTVSDRNCRYVYELEAFVSHEYRKPIIVHGRLRQRLDFVDRSREHAMRMSLHLVLVDLSHDGRPYLTKNRFSLDAKVHATKVTLRELLLVRRSEH